MWTQPWHRARYLTSTDSGDPCRTLRSAVYCLHFAFKETEVQTVEAAGSGQRAELVFSHTATRGPTLALAPLLCPYMILTL